MFVGFEISNPPALSKVEIERGATYRMPSVLGWGANCAKNPQQYLGDYVYIEPRQSDMMGAKLSELIVQILKRFRSATDVAPRHIVLYFSGISEGQWSLGTAKTPKYALVYDDSNIPMNVVEGMTHGLCYLHEIVTATVSVPVPLIVADRCAKRGHNVNQRDAVGSIKEANERLVNQGELQKVRYNA
ncbi:piwi domain protein [Ancylostoma ceylanicum]|uniref:Piwi domain protein n=1 Tax=Ancylostoma ceylanicum TaxID=53326 RepID=A0A0D6LWY9_9BILA|nr:piwi domain protein [Ancylostoma ceylanicum]